jgi:hypothetical protein
MSLCLFNEGSAVLNFTELLEKQILSRIESLKVRVSLLLDWLKLNRVFFLHLTGLIGEWPVLKTKPLFKHTMKQFKSK